jgi:hypothetical protein
MKMTMTIEQSKAALRVIAKAIIETVKESDSVIGAPGGHLYAAMMRAGCTLNQFEQIMSGLVQFGYLAKRGDCYFPGTKEMK